MDQVETEKTGYGGFERFLYLFFIPVLFTVILMSILLSLFGYDVMDAVLRTANKVPLLEYVVPDPKDSPSEPNVTADSEPKQQSDDDAELTEKIRLLEKQLEQEQLAAQSQQEQIEQLMQEIEALETQLTEVTTLQSEVTSIKQLARVYSQMSPNRAAPVLSQMGIEERLLVLEQMKPSDQQRILEKMDPAIAAETTLQQINQYRGQSVEEVEQTPQRVTALSSEEVSRTIAGMNPVSAAKLLLEMTKTNETQAVQILRGMDIQSRSSVMTELSNVSEEIAAKLAAKLGS